MSSHTGQTPKKTAAKRQAVLDKLREEFGAYRSNGQLEVDSARMREAQVEKTDDRYTAVTVLRLDSLARSHQFPVGGFLPEHYCDCGRYEPRSMTGVISRSCCHCGGLPRPVHYKDPTPSPAALQLEKVRAQLLARGAIARPVISTPHNDPGFLGLQRFDQRAAAHQEVSRRIHLELGVPMSEMRPCPECGARPGAHHHESCRLLVK